MWESTYIKDTRHDSPFTLTGATGHRGVICVWEFAAVAHEHREWTRYLLSARDGAAKRSYTQSSFKGLI